MSGITISQLPALSSVTATDSNILFLVTDQDSGNSSASLPLSVVYSSFSNLITSEASSAWNTANSASANTVYISGVSAQQNSNIQLAWNTANSASANTVYISGVSAQQNSNIQLAWNTSNNALPNTGGIVTGSLTVSGNLFATYVSSPIGSSANLIINADGINDVYITPLTQLFVQDNTASYSTNTGSIVVNGGIGIKGNVYANSVYANTFYGSANGLNGTVPSTVLGNSTFYIGSTAVSLNASVNSISTLLISNVITGNITHTGIDVIQPVYFTITANGTITLPSNTSTSVLIIANNAANVTVVMPTANVNGQVCGFSVVSNNTTLLLGAGSVAQTFIGLATSGSKFKYVYNLATTTWYTCP